ncbi:hypothetical protein M3S04_12215 [Xanthomonas sp. PPL139]|uniref:hypothetical protein n=1 Tax=unclassified Xanthomonas TaxID=2643310 RepID=UPI0033AB6E1B
MRRHFPAATCIAVALMAGIASPSIQARDSANPVPIRIIESNGHRPQIDTKVNGIPVLAIIHSNAGFYFQVNHARARELGIDRLTHVGSTGISEPGVPTKEGEDSGRIATLTIGGVTEKNATASIFEAIGQRAAMIGLPWITSHRLIIDFKHNQAWVSPTPDNVQKLHKRLLAEGYTAQPMSQNASGEYTVPVTINGQSTRLNVSTVGTVELDSALADRAQLSRSVSGSYAGPSGATGKTYRSDAPVTISMGDWHSRPTPVSILDTYDYIGDTRPTSPEQANGGMIGADFLAANQAVVDFGSSTLFVK